MTAPRIGLFVIAAGLLAMAPAVSAQQEDRPIIVRPPADRPAEPIDREILPPSDRELEEQIRDQEARLERRLEALEQAYEDLNRARLGDLGQVDPHLGLPAPNPYAAQGAPLPYGYGFPPLAPGTSGYRSYSRGYAGMPGYSIYRESYGVPGLGHGYGGYYGPVVRPPLGYRGLYRGYGGGRLAIPFLFGGGLDLRW